MPNTIRSHNRASVRFRRMLIMLLAVLIFTGAAFTQTTGTLRGTVKDTSNAVVPGATVKVTLEGTQQTRSGETDESGEYQFPVLAVGRYTLEVEIPGFKKYVRKDIEITLGRVVVVDPVLELGTISETITAEASAPLIETTSTQLGAVVDDRAVINLPLNTRDTYQFLQLQPGVQSQVGSDLFYGSDRAGVVSVNGGRGRANNFNVNGGEGNDLFVNLPAIQPSPDTIQEFRVLTNTFDAEFGRNSGAVVNVVTKSGTNNFHGSVYEFFRNKALNARGFFNTEKPDFKQNQFGFTLGGPIRRDRSYFFGSYEGRRIRRGSPSDTVTMPTLAERTGDFSGGAPFAGTLTDGRVAALLNARPGCAAAVAAAGGAPIAAGTRYADIFKNNIIPAACFDPTAVDLMNQFVSLPNLGGSLFQAAPTARDNVDQYTLRLDHKLGENQQFSAYYYITGNGLFEPFNRIQNSGANLPGFGQLSDQRIQQWNLSHTWTVSPSSVNEFRFTYFRQGQGTFLHPQRTHLVQQSCRDVPGSQCFSDPANPKLGITPGLGPRREGVPFVGLVGGFAIGNNFQGELPQIGNTFQWADNFTRIVGKHSLRFGTDVRRQRFDQTLYSVLNGAFTFTGGGPNDVKFDNLIPNYLLGLPDQYLQGSAGTEAIRSTSVYLYAQDSWKIRPSVTLNYGLRWELNTPMADRFKRLQTFRPGQSTTIFPCRLSPDNPLADTFGTTDCGPGSAGESIFPLGLVVPGDPGVPNGLTKTYYKAFAPRLGIAWSPGGAGKTSIRAGWGLFYNPIEQLVLQQFQGMPPFGGSSQLSNILFNTPFEGQDGSVRPNPFGGIFNIPRGRPLDWSIYRPILLVGQFPPNLRAQYSAQYNLTIQRELMKDLVLQVGYVGSQGHRLLATHDLNFGNPQTCLDLNQIPGQSCGPNSADNNYTIRAGTIPAGMTLHLPYGSAPTVIGPNPTDITLVGLRRYSSPRCEPTTGEGCPPDGTPVFGSIFSLDTVAKSNYNALQILLEKRFSKGLQFNAAYTLSKSIDNASSFENVLNPLDFRRSRSLSLFDARHRFVYSYYWVLPTSQRQGFVGQLINGWALAGITTFQSGFPIRIAAPGDRELMGSNQFESPGQPDRVAPFRRLDPRAPGNLFFDPASFAPSSLGSIGNAPRTVCCGPGINNFDIAVHKTNRISEHKRVEFRGEVFNLWNHAQFLNPDGNLGPGRDFARVRRARDPRLVQFALKFYF